MIDLNYDIALVDLDTTEGIEKYNLESFEQIYFVTSIDLYSIKRGLEAISGLNNPIHITKVYFSKEALKEEDDYLNFVSLGYKVIWEEERIYLPFEVGDQSVIYHNQRVSKIKFKKLSNQYKEGLIYLTTKLLKDVDVSLVRRTFKKIERGV